MSEFCADLEHVFDGDYDPDWLRSWFEWWLFDNPVGEGICAGAFVAGSRVGTCSATPKALVLDGTEFLAFEVVQAYTKREYEGKGIFTRLVRFLMEEARASGADLLYATPPHPRQTSGRVFLGRLGFDLLFHPVRYLRPVPNPVALTPAAGTPVRISYRLAAELLSRLARGRLPQGWRVDKDTSLDPEIPALVSSATTSRTCYVRRDLGYLKWRYAYPGRKYEHHYLRDDAGRLVGWASVREEPTFRGNRAYIGDFWVRGAVPKYFDYLMAGVAGDAKSRGMAELYTCAQVIRMREPPV